MRRSYENVMPIRGVRLLYTVPVWGANFRRDHNRFPRPPPRQQAEAGGSWAGHRRRKTTSVHAYTCLYQLSQSLPQLAASRIADGAEPYKLAILARSLRIRVQPSIRSIPVRPMLPEEPVQACVCRLHVARVGMSFDLWCLLSRLRLCPFRSAPLYRCPSYSPAASAASVLLHRLAPNLTQSGGTCPVATSSRSSSSGWRVVSVGQSGSSVRRGHGVTQPALLVSSLQAFTAVRRPGRPHLPRQGSTSPDAVLYRYVRILHGWSLPWSVLFRDLQCGSPLEFRSPCLSSWQHTICRRRCRAHAAWTVGRMLALSTHPYNAARRGSSARPAPERDVGDWGRPPLTFPPHPCMRGGCGEAATDLSPTSLHEGGMRGGRH